MAERFKAAVLKTVERKLRGFESLSLRQKASPMKQKPVIGSRNRIPPLKGIRKALVPASAERWPSG